ncbi:MAG TPA: hypothetical protein VJX16_23755 [Terriglobales bacterium]|nr:hypothetical protein [Terriglobales bacterium]
MKRFAGTQIHFCEPFELPGRFPRCRGRCDTNKEVIAIDQDTLGQQGWRVWQSGEQEIWVRDLDGGAKAVGLFNRSAKDSDITANWPSLGIHTNSQQLRFRDLWTHRDLTSPPAIYSTVVPGHGVVLLRVQP